MPVTERAAAVDSADRSEGDRTEDAVGAVAAPTDMMTVSIVDAREPRISR